MPFRILRRYKMVKRYGKIIDTLIKYEFGNIVDQMKLRPFESIKSKFKGYCELNGAPLTGPERAKQVLEELGPTYVKLGQILSVRQDLIPIEYANEFAKLQDAVLPFEFEYVKKLIRRELGKNIDEIFSDFDPMPLAAASIGQVHCAKLCDGTDVVVKVQRPGIKKVIEADIDIMYSIAEFAEEHIHDAKLYRATDVVDEFSRSIHAEIDYTQEARNVDRFSTNFKDDPNIYIPKVYWDFCSERVLTLEYIKGTKSSDFEKIEELGFDRNEIATCGAKAFMKQIFEDGFFHADMHPGNIIIMDDGKIALIDFGMVGHLSDDTRNALIDGLIATSKGEIDVFIEILRDFDAITKDVDITELKVDLEYLLNKYYGRSLKQLDASTMIVETIGVLRKHQAKVPASVALLSKGVVTISGFGAMMVPDFNATILAEPYTKKMMANRMRPKSVVSGAFKDVWNFARMMHKVPTQVTHILDSAEKGYLNIKFEHSGLDRIVSEFNAASNRLSFSLIIAALIVGSSLIIQTGMEPHVWGVPLLGVIGFSISGFFGMGLVIYILRTGRI
ncbi:MAG: AarF/ABC1/UbiB kinase family protein [Methanosarcinaceae archaeon]|nr:AarF/ABC1/UbiB kinase family protein [Methanosarcinaceae archaeon]